MPSWHKSLLWNAEKIGAHLGTLLSVKSFDFARGIGVQRLGVFWPKHGKVHGSLSELRMGQLGIFPLRK